MTDEEFVMKFRDAYTRSGLHVSVVADALDVSQLTVERYLEGENLPRLNLRHVMIDAIQRIAANTLHANVPADKLTDRLRMYIAEYDEIVASELPLDVAKERIRDVNEFQNEMTGEEHQVLLLAFCNVLKGNVVT